MRFMLHATILGFQAGAALFPLAARAEEAAGVPRFEEVWEAARADLERALDASEPGGPAGGDGDDAEVDRATLVPALSSAVERFRIARALDPWHEPTRELLEKSRTALYEVHRERALELVAAGRELSARRELLAASAAATPDARVRSLLSQTGHELYRGCAGVWLHRDDILRREQASVRHAGAARRRLGLGTGFELARRRELRIWTDLDPTRHAVLLDRLLSRLEVLECGLLRLFAPLRPADPAASGGVDVILFGREAEYRAFTGSTDTAGLWLREPGASCFWLPDRGDEEWREAFLVEVFQHELVHQLVSRMLELPEIPPWLEEGLAVALETASVDEDVRVVGWEGSRIPPSVREAYDQEGARPEPERLEELASTDREGLRALSDGERRLFYGDAAIWVLYLLEGGRDTRRALFSLLAELRGAEGPVAADPERFSRIYGSLEQTMEETVSRLRQFYEGPRVPRA